MTKSLLLGIGLALAIGGAARADTVKVGVIIPASGPFATWGHQTAGGVRVYQELHGKQVAGNDVDVVIRDDGGPNPARARQLAEEFVVRDRVSFLMGFAFSPNALAVADLVTRAKTPTILTNAASGSITGKSPYFVRVSFSLGQVAAPLGQWAAKSGYATVASVIADYLSGTESNAAFATSFTAGGGRVVDTIRVPLDVVDFAPYYQRVLQDKPRAMYGFGTGGANSLTMVRSWSERLRPAGIAFLGALQLQQMDLPAIGDAAIGVVSSTHYPEHADNPLNQALWRQWRKDFPDPHSVPDIATVAAYDAMELIYRAVAKFGPTVTGDQAIGFFKGMQVVSPRGSFTIDPQTRDIVQNVYLQKVEKRNDILENVPFDVIKDVR